jgi:guanylate kinase
MNDLSLVISAPSGAGKTTLIARLLDADDRLVFSVSTTTRPNREGEAEGESYYFVSPSEFRKMIGEDSFIEWAQVHRNYYGTTKKEIDRITRAGKIPIFDVDVQGARSLKHSVDNATSILYHRAAGFSFRDCGTERPNQNLRYRFDLRKPAGN